jgi:two-component system, LytTR family, response regulator
MKALIIEDEKASREYLRSILQQHFPQLNIAGVADNVPDAIALIQDKKPDLIFLDVEIKLGSGFDVLDGIPDPSFEVIFTTAFQSFALEAFRVHAVDYLLKPLQADLVVSATQRSVARILSGSGHEMVRQLVRQLQQPAAGNKLVLHTMEGLEFTDMEDIMYAAAKGNYTLLYLNSGAKITISKKLKDIEEALPVKAFFRVHHSYVVNRSYISKYHKGRGGYLVLKEGSSLPVSSSRKDGLLDWLK